MVVYSLSQKLFRIVWIKRTIQTVKGLFGWFCGQFKGLFDRFCGRVKGRFGGVVWAVFASILYVIIGLEG